MSWDFEGKMFRFVDSIRKAFGLPPSEEYVAYIRKTLETHGQNDPMLPQYLSKLLFLTTSEEDRQKEINSLQEQQARAKKRLSDFLLAPPPTPWVVELNHPAPGKKWKGGGPRPSSIFRRVEPDDED